MQFHLCRGHTWHISYYHMDSQFSQSFVRSHAAGSKEDFQGELSAIRAIRDRAQTELFLNFSSLCVWLISRSISVQNGLPNNCPWRLTQGLQVDFEGVHHFSTGFSGLQRLRGFHERRLGGGCSWSSTLGPHWAAAASEVEEPMGSDDRCHLRQSQEYLWSAEIFTDVGWFCYDLSLFMFFCFFNSMFFLSRGFKVGLADVFQKNIFNLPPNHKVLRSKDISTVWRNQHRTAWVPCRVVPKLWSSQWRCHTPRPYRMRKNQIPCLVDDVFVFSFLL